MKVFVAFLRGINVGGHRVSGPELVQHFQDLDLGEPRSFLASGNIVFEAPKVAGLEKRIESGLRDALGYDVPTVLRTKDEVCALNEMRPFSEDQVKASKGKAQVWLLRKAPVSKVASQLTGFSTSDDPLVLDGRELHWLPSGGILESALDLKSLEKLLGIRTLRTHNTIQRLSKKYFA